jgi:hypothetical protein
MMMGIADKLNKLERAIEAAEQQIDTAELSIAAAEQQITTRLAAIDDAKWSQAKEISRLLEAGLATQQEIADDWQKPDGSTYGRPHVGHCAKAWRSFATVGSKDRPSFAKAYAAAKASPGRARQQTEAGDKLWCDERVLAWVAAGRQRGLNRDDFMPASKKAEHNWPIKGKHLPQNGVDRCIAILDDREKRPAPTPKAQPKPTGKRLREISAQQKAEARAKNIKLMNVARQIVKQTSLLESIDIEDFDLDDVGQDALQEIFDDLVDGLMFWTELTARAIGVRLREQAVRAKIKHLRENTNGRTLAEIDTASVLADKLERKLKSNTVKLTTV